MHVRRIAILAVLIAATFLPVSVITPVALAQDPHQARAPISFTLTPEQCSDLTVTVMGSAEQFIVTNERMDKNGVDHLVINALANGTATDSDGATYLFEYHNHQSIDVQPGGFPQQVLMTDHFNLNGNGRAGSLHVGFVIRVTITGPNTDPIVAVVNERGNSACDPI